jgi:hypothetical protein
LMLINELHRYLKVYLKLLLLLQKGFGLWSNPNGVADYIF